MGCLASTEQERALLFLQPEMLWHLLDPWRDFQGPFKVQRAEKCHSLSHPGCPVKANPAARWKPSGAFFPSHTSRPGILQSINSDNLWQAVICCEKSQIPLNAPKGWITFILWDVALWQVGLSLLVVTATGQSPRRRLGIPKITHLKGHPAAGGTCKARWDAPSLSFMHFPALGRMGSAGAAWIHGNSHLPRSSSHLLITSSAKPRVSSPPSGLGDAFPLPWEGWVCADGLSFGFKPELDWSRQSHRSVPIWELARWKSGFKSIGK